MTGEMNATVFSIVKERQSPMHNEELPRERNCKVASGILFIVAGTICSYYVNKKTKMIII